MRRNRAWSVSLVGTLVLTGCVVSSPPSRLSQYVAPAVTAGSAAPELPASRPVRTALVVLADRSAPDSAPGLPEDAQARLAETLAGQINQGFPIAIERVVNFGEVPAGGMLPDWTEVARQQGVEYLLVTVLSSTEQEYPVSLFLGWTTHRQGYLYSPIDPQTNKPWPAMPQSFHNLCQRAATAAGYPDFQPDACLINRYAPGAKLSLHQDKDEPDLRAPIVSVSLGLPAIFQVGGLKRNDPLKRLLLEHGDVVVWGGESRLFYHGIQPLKAGFHPLTTDCRYNLTFRQAGKKE